MTRNEKSTTKREEWALKKHQKARELLVKRGVDLNDLIMLDDSFDEGAFEYLLVFPDRVEYINNGKPGLLGKKGKGTEVIPISRISSVTTTKKLVFETVKITTSGQAIDFKSTPWVAPILKQTILGLMTQPSTLTTSEVKQTDPTEQLAKGAELHKAGILTDEEFAEKKMELLKRI